MDDLSRSEYPAMLASLQSGQAAQALSDRVKRISRVNQEIADWLQERRRVEELYASGLRKLLLFKVPSAQSELGVFQSPWDKILHSVDAIAASHHLFAQRIEKDVEHALRGFQNKREMQNMQTIGANLQTMARELDEAQDKSDKLTKKGGKANAQKVDQVTSRLESATQQWESQAPFIFETLQALDEQRVNHLRDVLTQLETHEVDQAARTQAAAEEVLNTMLEVNTSQEVQNFVQRTIAGKPKLERRTPAATRQNSVVAPSALSPPTTAGHEDDVSDHSGTRDGQLPDSSKLRSRIGTMFGRRRQSIHGGFGPISPQKNMGSFTRSIGSSHGRAISPRGSSHNLADSSHRLSSLAESPTSAQPPDTSDGKPKPSHEGTNGVTGGDDAAPVQSSLNMLNGTAEDIFDAPPPAAGPQPTEQNNNQEAVKDAEGYTVPAPLNDPITQAQKEAAAAGEEADRFFKLNIQKEPVSEEDPDAKKAALSNVANTLTQMGMPSRSNTMRGRRDVRNTIYMPSLPVPEPTSENPFPPSPALPSSTSRPLAVSALASEASIAGTSDTQSVRSGISLGSLTQHKHPEMYGPGLNASIIEYVSASFDGGEVKDARINGEIAFSYNADPTSSIPDHETIRINNFPVLAAIGPNRIVVNNTPFPDEFTLDLTHLAKPSPSFTYRVHAEDASSSLASHCPLVIKPTWKPAGDKLGLLIQYRLNPDSKVPRPATLNNVIIFATYEGARASGAQSKPASTHLKDKHVVYWRLGDVTPTDDWSKIVCRIIGEQGGEPAPGHVEARWEYAAPASAAAGIGSGISVSRLVEGKGKGKAVIEEEEDEEEGGDPFADEKGSVSPALKDDTRTWADVLVVRKLASGKYEAK